MKLGKRRVRLNIRSCSWLPPVTGQPLTTAHRPRTSPPRARPQGPPLSRNQHWSNRSLKNHIFLEIMMPPPCLIYLFAVKDLTAFSRVLFPAYPKVCTKESGKGRNHSTSISIVTKRTMKKLGSERPGGFSKATGVWRNLSQFTALTTSSQPPALRSSPNTRDV